MENFDEYHFIGTAKELIKNIDTKTRSKYPYILQTYLHNNNVSRDFLLRHSIDDTELKDKEINIQTTKKELIAVLDHTESKIMYDKNNENNHSVLSIQEILDKRYPHLQLRNRLRLAKDSSFQEKIQMRGKNTFDTVCDYLGVNVPNLHNKNHHIFSTDILETWQDNLHNLILGFHVSNAIEDVEDIWNHNKEAGVRSLPEEEVRFDIMHEHYKKFIQDINIFLQPYASEKEFIAIVNKNIQLDLSTQRDFDNDDGDDDEEDIGPFDPDDDGYNDNFDDDDF